MAPRLLSCDQARRLIGVGRTSFYQLVTKGELPRPLHPLPGAARWREDEIRAYIERLTEARDRTAAA